MLIISCMFFLSGFAGLVYQIVWLRLAYASFGVITPVLSLVIAVFMLGLSLGSWLGGRYIAGIVKRTRLPAVYFYGMIEIITALSAFAVPVLFKFSENLLMKLGAMNSIPYMIVSGFLICCSLLPWCVCMGATFPFMMEFMRNPEPGRKESFGFLYASNVFGALTGASAAAGILIEFYGLAATLDIACFLNICIAVMAFVTGLKHPYKFNQADREKSMPVRSVHDTDTGIITVLLFFSGFCSMGMEVAWTRAFTFVLQTTIYSFAFILCVYLFATWAGSLLYVRLHLKFSSVMLAKMASVSVFLPVIFNDPRLNPSWFTVFSCLFPFCFILGYMTPCLIDSYSRGDALRAGKIYAINILGCILGPLSASYVLLPALGVKMTLVFFSFPFFLICLVSGHIRIPYVALQVLLILAGIFIFTDYEGQHIKKGSLVKRDYAAGVICSGSGMAKQLYVNGVGITKLTTITKFMAHLPLAFTSEPPGSALVICLGMGTTFRSLLSWNIKVKAVELVPGVRESLDYFFAGLKSNPNGEIIVDDGRRFLKRSDEKFDVITIDPPPPIEAAGSSLLYSSEFYDIAKKRLKKGGVLHQWFPEGELKILLAAARSFADSFPYVRTFAGIEGWGVHFLGSMSPMPVITAEEFLNRMPETARQDLAEWLPSMTPYELVSGILEREMPSGMLLHPDREMHISDDRPYNEYFIVRRILDWNK